MHGLKGQLADPTTIKSFKLIGRRGGIKISLIF